MLNSWNPKQTNDKAPLTISNLPEIEKELLGFQRFLTSLKLTTGTLVCTSRRKAVAVGFTATIISTVALAWDVLTQSNSLSCLCTRLTQQDPLEHFFSIIRLRCGLNNNPTAIQVKYIMRKLLVIKSGGVTASLSSNCSLLPSTTLEDQNCQIEQNPVEEETAIEMEMFCNEEELNASNIDDAFTNQSLAYIAGYCVVKMERQFDCNMCRKALYDSTEDPLDKDAANIKKLRKYRLMCIPSNSVYKIVLACESVFQMLLSQRLKSSPCDVIAMSTQKVLTIIDVNAMFPSLHLPAHSEKCKVKNLVKSVALRFLKVRCLSYIKVFNQNVSQETSNRNQLTKLILYNNL
jgi:hypothetical protein